MATIYSNLYQLPPNANAGAGRIYSGPHAERRGQTVTRFATYTGTIGADDLYIAGGFLRGEKLIGFTAAQSGDGDTDNDFTFNLGWRVGTAATPATAFLSASTGLQATTPVELDAGDLATDQAAAEGDDLVLQRAAGEIEASITLTFVAVSFIP